MSALLAIAFFPNAHVVLKIPQNRAILPPNKQPSLLDINAITDLPLLYQPGEKWVYGINTDVLARVVEAASGKKFSAFLNERFFTPLGMPDTGFHSPAHQSGGGSLVSTITDYARLRRYHRP